MKKVINTIKNFFNPTKNILDSNNQTHIDDITRIIIKHVKRINNVYPFFRQVNDKDVLQSIIYSLVLKKCSVDIIILPYINDNGNVYNIEVIIDKIMPQDITYIVDDLATLKNALLYENVNICNSLSKLI